MNFQFYVEKLINSEKYKEFINKNPDAYLCSGFFIIDLEGKDDRLSQVQSISSKRGQNKQHFDYFLPKEKKMFSFQLESGCNPVNIEMIDNKIPEKISLDLDFDFNEIEKLIQEKMQEENINNKIQKFLFSLQNLKDKHFLIGTVFISMLGMVKVSINLNEMQIIDFEKKSFFDIMKVKKAKKD